MEIITAQTACNRIKNVMSEMDLDDLAKTVSLLTNTEGVIVVDDGVEIDEDVSLIYSPNALVNFVADDTVGISDVFVDGQMFGYIDEHGEIIELTAQYTARQPLNEQDIGTINAHLENKDLIPIYDDQSGKLVCYANAEYANTIVASLEKQK
jgi:hypothetical protein